MRVIKSPEEYVSNFPNIKCFLAGGLANCTWQDRFMERLNELDPHHFVLFNPKRDDFNVDDLNMEREQIEWEFKYLNRYINDELYIFSMYFDKGGSVQPICFYELGRYLVKMNWNLENCIISVNPKFSRKNDVIIQTELATKGKVIVQEVEPEEHADLIYKKYIKLKHNCQGLMA